MCAIYKKGNLPVRGGAIPFQIHAESRRNIRFSIVKSGAIMRFPKYLDKKEYGVEEDRFFTWVQEKFADENRLIDQHFGKKYEDGDQLVVGEHTYTIRIVDTNQKSHKAKREGAIITLFIAKGDSDYHLAKAIKHLLSRIVSQHQVINFSKRVDFFNDSFFKVSLGEIRFKYMHSRWGSCSSKGNLNFSSRILFAPRAVQDSVIVHELAHRIEMNHSAKFWKLVKNAMPDYQVHDAWLKANGKMCDF